MVRSTIHPALQRAAEAALQEGLARYELNTGRAQFQAAEANLADAIAAHRGRAETAVGKPAWQQALENARLPALRRALAAPRSCSRRRAGAAAARSEVGLADGRVLPLTAGPRHRAAQSQAARRRLRQVRARRKGKTARAELRVRPHGAGRRGGAREPDRPHPRHGRRLLLSAEPAQPRHPVAAPAGLGAQAADLSRGAAARACSRTRWCATSRSRCRRSAAMPTRVRGLLVAEELRRRRRPA